MSYMKTRSRRQSPLSQETFPARIDALAHDGRGIAHLDGKAVFIHGALPGENVTFNYTRRHSKHDEGEIAEVMTPAPDRVSPPCRHFGVCGGCNLQHLAPERQVNVKQDWLLENLRRIGGLQPEQILEPLTGPTGGYRRKARLGVKYVAKKERVLVGFRERRKPYLADLNRCEVLHPAVGERLEMLAQLIQELSIYPQLPQIEVAVGDEAVALNFRVLAPPSETDKAKLAAFARHWNIRIYLQPKGPETTYLLWPEAAPPLHYRLPDHATTLQFEPYHFTQINADINRRMVNRVLRLLDLRGDERILDLFCGLGNFSLALARHCREVVGVEGDETLVAQAEHNARLNGIGNAHFFPADLTGEVTAYPWMQPSYEGILLDPPRSGALEMIPRLAALGARRIVYVSCHPATLARDIGELVHRFGYRLLSAGVMDMFPHTAHVESIVLLER